MKTMLQKACRVVAFAMLLLAFAFAMAVPASAQSTDITGVVTSVSGYETSAIAIGIAILLFVIGRTVVRKLIK